MRLRRALVWLAAFLSIPVVVPSPADAQVDPADEIVALVVEGVGYGHGRGMSQWGAFGWAVNYGKSWTWILGHYYAGTAVSTSSATARVRVRLLGHDGDKNVGVISSTNRALWRGSGYAAVQAREVAANRFDIYVSSTPRCPERSVAGWTRVAEGVAGPVTFATSVSETTAKPGEVLGLCVANTSSVVHYRGSIQFLRDSAGTNRVVNDVRVESYLRGVVSREVSTSWGDAGGGNGIHALRAQAVAARSYTRAQHRYAYAHTCDTTSCQYYGGAAQRATPTSPPSGGVTCEAGNPSFECAHSNRAILQTSGVILRWPDQQPVSTEFSASNGPQTAGGIFPSVNDPADDVPSNPNHRWTRVIDAHTLASVYNLGTLTGALSEPDPNLQHTGIWDNRVRFTGANGTAVVTDLTIRNAFGLPSPGFVVRPFRRDVDTVTSMAFIGDSVGLSMTETANSELRALLDRVVAPATYDSVGNRCVSGCALSGVGAAASVPLGTDLVVVELGYNGAGSNFASQIDAMMHALANRAVERVAWVNLTERSGRNDYISANRALVTATGRWSNLTIVDWRTASAGNTGNRRRWFATDNIHLTFTGQAEMARFLRNEIVRIA